MRRIFPLLFTVFLSLMLTTSCKKDRIFTGNTKLKFSQDTIWFDTIFTREPGAKYPISVTHRFSIYNKENSSVKVSFRLGGGKNSPYRINVDGFAGPEIPSVEILPKDSVFVFVQCSLDANNQTNPSLVLDSMMSVVNGTEQKTYLAAYGWDAHYFHSVELTANETWTDKVKPYVIVDDILIDAGKVFTIKEGVTVYNSARSVLYAVGQLKIEGTASEPVRFMGDKPGHAFQELPNQWGGIYLTRGSSGNSIKYANIHNASIGIRVDSLPDGNPLNLRLENTEIMFCGQGCLIGITAFIQATNCLFAEAGTYTFLGLLGGNYDFRHCTFASYVTYATRQNGHFAITNTQRNDNGFIIKTAPLTCFMKNCIVYGPQKEEIFKDDKGSAAFTATDIENNIFKSAEHPFVNNLYNTDPLFKSTASHQFWIDTLSPAINAGVALIPPIAIDILGKPRSNPPDIGAFERQ